MLNNMKADGNKIMDKPSILFAVHAGHFQQIHEHLHLQTVIFLVIHKVFAQNIFLTVFQQYFDILSNIRL